MRFNLMVAALLGFILSTFAFAIPETTSSNDALHVEFAKLADIKHEMAILHAIQLKQERAIMHLLRQDFHQCQGVQCIVQTAMEKAPDFAHLIAEHFSHEKMMPKKNEQLEEIAFIQGLELPEASPSSQGHRPLEESPAVSAPSPIDGEHLPRPPSDINHDHPPESGFPHPPPGAGERPHHHPPPPPPYHKGPPEHHGEHPEPPFHHGGHGNRPPPPHQGGHSKPPPDHKHGPPSIFHQIRHNRFLVLKAALALFAATFLLSTLVRFARYHLPGVKDRHMRRRADRASRREERRRRCQYRRASHRHRISSWWAAHNPRRPNAAGTADYDEKRTLILQQEGILENAMQQEIRNLEIAAELEEGRGRPHTVSCARNITPTPQGLDSGVGSSRLTRQTSYPSSDYPAPPPRYEEELDDEVIPVNGFMYTPSNTESTPESSIVDFSPRMSYDTLDTKSDTLD